MDIPGSTASTAILQTPFGPVENRSTSSLSIEAGFEALFRNAADKAAGSTDGSGKQTVSGPIGFDALFGPPELSTPTGTTKPNTSTAGAGATGATSQNNTGISQLFAQNY
jgi:hypothetical protein